MKKKHFTTLLIAFLLASNLGYAQVVINEIVASNDSTSNIKDPAGESEDWIELYNNTTSSINISGYSLSDDFMDMQKWQFPSETIIPGNGFLIVWADKDTDQEGLHTNFKLKKSGEQLALSDASGTLLDSISFGEQTTNMAFARHPNGTGDFAIQATTFNSSNNELAINNLTNTLSLSISPSIATDYIQIKTNKAVFHEVRILSSTGKLLLLQKEYSPSFRVELGHFASGIYFVQIIDRQGNSGLERFIVR